MSLSVDIRHQFGGFTLETAFEAKSGVTAIFGHSGSGKTSVVNAVAGLFRPDEGRISWDGKVLFDGTKGKSTPPYLRKMGYVFQDGRLFPHLTVKQNLAYPGRFLKEPAKARESDAIIALLGLDSLLDRRPGRLSGGEKQRVAIGRALLAKPNMLLLDEPLAALDLDRRSEVLPYLARIRDETELPILYVSHARSEVRALASHVVILKGGRVSADGTVGEVLGRGGAGPTTTLQVTDHGPAEAGMVRLETRLGRIYSLCERIPFTGPRSISITASDIVLSAADRESIAAPNVLAVDVNEILKAGPGHMDVRLAVGDAELIARLPIGEAARISLAPGSKFQAIIGRFKVS